MLRNTPMALSQLSAGIGMATLCHPETQSCITGIFCANDRIVGLTLGLEVLPARQVLGTEKAE